MKSKIVIIIVGILVVAIGFVIFRPKKETVQVNNTTCPVSGNPVNDRDTYTYKGKEYKLCDEGCKRPLSENPEKYLSD